MIILFIICGGKRGRRRISDEMIQREADFKLQDSLFTSNSRPARPEINTGQSPTVNKMK